MNFTAKSLLESQGGGGFAFLCRKILEECNKIGPCFVLLVWAEKLIIKEIMRKDCKNETLYCKNDVSYIGGVAAVSLFWKRE